MAKREPTNIQGETDARGLVGDVRPLVLAYRRHLRISQILTATLIAATVVSFATLVLRDDPAVYATGWGCDVKAPLKVVKG